MVVVFLVGFGSLILIESEKFATMVECQQAAAFVNMMAMGERLAVCINLAQGI